MVSARLWAMGRAWGPGRSRRPATAVQMVAVPQAMLSKAESEVPSPQRDGMSVSCALE
jgi:hypothetical protein